MSRQVQAVDGPDSNSAPDDRAARKRGQSEALKVFVVALAIRVAVASIFFGSIDVINSLDDMPVAAVHLTVNVPYFPLVVNWLGLAALIAAHARFLPLGLVPKLLPCLADSLLAAWFVRDNRYDDSIRSRAGWIYATCPVAIMIVCLQGQWDAVWLLPIVAALAVNEIGDRAPRRASVAVGALAALAILLKPTPIVLVPLVLCEFRRRRSLRRWCADAAYVVLGMAACFIAAFSWFAWERIDLSANFHSVLNYATTSATVVVFGLEKLQFFTFLTDPVTALRRASIAAALFIVVYQHFRKNPVDRMAAAAAVMLVLPAIGGLAPQYLIWPLPFLLASGRIRLSVLYGAVSSLFLVVYYAIPGASFFPGENSATYVPLRHLSAFAIPNDAKSWLASPTLLQDVWHPLANVAAPLALLALAAFVLWPRHRARSSRLPLRDASVRVANVLASRAAMVTLPLVVVFVVALVAYRVGPYNDVPEMLYVLYVRDATWYAVNVPIQVSIVQAPSLSAITPPMFSSITSGSWFGTILVTMPILILIWSGASLRASHARVSRSPEALQLEHEMTDG